MKRNIAIISFLIACSTVTVSAQKISISGQLGWSTPKGKAFTYDDNSKSAKGGIGFTTDILYHLADFDEKLAVGLVYNGAFLASVGSSDQELSSSVYNLYLYGFKGYYRAFEGHISPYGSFSLGLSNLKTPSITVNNLIIADRQSSFSMGMAPEFGLDVYGFTASILYFVPMKYKTWADKKETAGSMRISIGYRYSF